MPGLFFIPRMFAVTFFELTCNSAGRGNSRRFGRKTGKEVSVLKTAMAYCGPLFTIETAVGEMAKVTVTVFLVDAKESERNKGLVGLTRAACYSRAMLQDI